AFAIGNLPEPDFTRLADHVATCKSCEASLPAFDGCHDGLLACLKDLTKSGTDAGLELPDELLRGARQAQSFCSNGTPPELSLDSGRRYARQLATGDCRLGKFELVSELGAGSFGYVFRARDTELDRTVAVKIQRAGSLADHEEASRF